METIEVFHKSSQTLINIVCMIGTAIDSMRVSHDSFVSQCEKQGVHVIPNKPLCEQFSVNSTMVRLLVGTLGVEVIQSEWYANGWKLTELTAERWFDYIVKREFLGVAPDKFE